jgi:hypothetical protein
LQISHLENQSNTAVQNEPKKMDQHARRYKIARFLRHEIYNFLFQVGGGSGKFKKPAEALIHALNIFT